MAGGSSIVVCHPLTGDADDVSLPVITEGIGFNFSRHAFVVKWAPERRYTRGGSKNVCAPAMIRTSRLQHQLPQLDPEQGLAPAGNLQAKFVRDVERLLGPIRWVRDVNLRVNKGSMCIAVSGVPR